MNNNNDGNQKKIRLWEEISKNGGVKSSDTNTYVRNRIFIVGDSIVKHLRGYELSRKVENGKVYVKSFSGAKVTFMEDFVKPTLREMPTHIILHVGTNASNLHLNKRDTQVLSNVFAEAISNITN